MVDLLERIEVLLKQESLFYKTEDYLAPAFQLKLQTTCVFDASTWQSGSQSTSTSSSNTSGINELWREKICEWTYQVIDHFDFSREIVSIAIHYLDRYLATRPVNKKLFQLAAMTTLYLAIKIYEPGNLSMASMIELSRGYFKVEQMVEMEMAILRALAWKVHPPTAYCFSKHVLFLLPYTSVTMDARHDILELSRFLAELSVIDYFFVMHRPSVVALATLLNALDLVPGVSEAARQDFQRELQHIPGLDLGSLEIGSEVEACRNRLHLLYAQGGYSRPETAGGEEPRTETISPVCVSYSCNSQPHTSLQHQSQPGGTETPKQQAFNFSNMGMGGSQFHL